MRNKEELKEMVGEVPVHIHVERDTGGEDYVKFSMASGRIFTVEHWRDCCEHVELEDLTGDIEAMVGHPIVVAEERVNDEYDDNTEVWTFYTFRSHGGTVDLRWHGTGSGYYSVAVNVSIEEAL